ncbi:MAG: HD domain-containing protein [Lachnospiraceae bacterium]|nr:HD domain-containing protein [Lachnospiraceae bacterium]
MGWKSKIMGLMSLVFALMLPAACFCEEGLQLKNASGVLNRPVSVDLIGHSEGYSAVLYDNSNGLPTSEANAIAETSEGFIWIGSYAGLIRYDGNTFERMDSTNGISSIKCLYVDSKDRLWIGTNDNGVAVLENGEYRMWGKLDGMKSAHTRAITEDEDGTIYVATTCGVVKIDPQYQLSMMEETEIAEANMRDLRRGSDGIIYGLSNFGDLMKIEDGVLKNFLKTEDNPIEGGVGSIIPDPESPGKIYFEGADYTLHHASYEDTLTGLETIDMQPLSYVQRMEYIDGCLWICASNGIGVLKDGVFHLLENLPMDNNVGSVMTDYLGNLWFTSTRQGVMKVVPNQFSNLFERYGLPPAVVNTTCMCEDKLFVGTDTGLIVIGKDGPLESLPLSKAESASGKELEAKDLISLLEGCRIRSIIRDSQGRAWISTWRKLGLLRYDRGELLAFDEGDGPLSNSMRSVCEREDGSMLVALTGGVNLIEGDRVVASYGEDNGITNTESLTVCEGTDGDIVLGSNGGGIYIINKTGVRNINVEDGLPSDIVMRLKRDKKRDLIWIVTSSAIAYMTPDYQVTTVQKFPYTNNFDLYENSKGDMWVLASNGIYVAPVEEFIANGEIDTVYYSLANGLPCITTANSYSELTPEGDLYIAGSTGICKVNIEKPFDDVDELKVVVPYLEVDGKTVYPDGEGDFTIPSSTKKLTVPSFVFNYSLNDPQVSYRLEGFDSQSTTVDRSDMVPVDFTNLKGGTYRYVMELKDPMGGGDKEVSVQIVKEKKFYEQVWFMILVVLLSLCVLVAGVLVYVRSRIRKLERKHRETYEQFEQTAEALAGAIDAKDAYTNGHSRRVAEYSLRIAKAVGRSEEECEKVYFAALLHDVGKIGIPNSIINKKGRLSDSEFEQIKRHPVLGGQILSSIKNSPWLSIGARYHHERYGGKGYPEGLKGEEIPEIARMIAVADAYDAMTSNRSYRNAIPQHIVREEIVKGVGTQFDPEFAMAMLHMIDEDTEYRMQESGSGTGAEPLSSIRCDRLYHDCTKGIAVTDKPSRISLCSQPDDGYPEKESLPSLILFDSLDGEVHPGEEGNKNLLYYEVARIRLDGEVEKGNLRKSETRVYDGESEIEQDWFHEPERGQRYLVEAVRHKDHAMVKISDENRMLQVILALPDTSRFLYVSIGGEHCFVHNIRVDGGEEPIAPEDIPRIAEEISYIKDCPEGDIPNVQVDGWRTESSEGIPIKEGMILTFHARSLPTARLVWHCPFVSIFSSADGQAGGRNFREYMLLRLDGETWESNEHVENKIQVERKEDFAGWEAWMEGNRQGIDCRVEIRKEKNVITMTTENQGISIRVTTKIRDDVKEVYAALTGDQCALSDIHIMR